MLLVNLKHYGQKYLILVSPLIACPISNMYPRLIGSIKHFKGCVQYDWAAMPFKRIYKFIIIHIFATAIFGKVFLLRINLARDCKIPKAIENQSLELFRNTRGFATSRQENISSTPTWWTPEHHWYRSQSWSNRFKPPIKPSGQLFIWNNTNRKMTTTLTLDPYQYDWGCDWMLWNFEHLRMSRWTHFWKFSWPPHSTRLLWFPQWWRRQWQ